MKTCIVILLLGLVASALCRRPNHPGPLVEDVTEAPTTHAPTVAGNTTTPAATTTAHVTTTVAGNTTTPHPTGSSN